VKGNIGHLESAAGIVGIIKTVLQINNMVLYPNIFTQNYNPEIDFTNSPFSLVTKIQKWESNYRVAGVSSFGAAGTNGHIILSNLNT